MRLEDYLNEVLAICAEEFNVSIDDVRSVSRKQELVYCRKAYSIMIKEKLDLKHETIASTINRTPKDVSLLISNQPVNKYYSICLKRIKMKIDTFQ